MAKKTPRVEILSTLPLDTPRVRALLSLKLTTQVGEFVFHQCRVIEDQPGVPVWVSPPQEVREGKYYTLVCWPSDVRKAILSAVRTHMSNPANKLDLASDPARM